MNNNNNNEKDINKELMIKLKKIREKGGDLSQPLKDKNINTKIIKDFNQNNENENSNYSLS